MGRTTEASTANGCGKTTLLRVLTDNEQRDSGEIHWGVRNNVEFAYYNEMLDELDLDDTVTREVNTFRMALNAPRKVVNQFLTLMQFSEMDLRRKLSTLSGGERARVALAKCLFSISPAAANDSSTPARPLAWAALNDGWARQEALPC